MVGRTRPCDERLAAGRLEKATQFLGAAETIRDLADDEADVGDAFVTLCVHAGIAAADYLCCAALGHHAQGDDHEQAVGELKKVRPDGTELGNALGVLLGMKTRAGYDFVSVNAEMRKRAWRRAKQLVDAARLRRTRA